MSLSSEIRIVEDVAEVWQDDSKILDTPLAKLLDQVLQRADRMPSCGILPRYTRLWRERGDAVGVVIEVPRHARTVRWIAENSKDPFGRRARYQDVFLAFPYVIILVVFYQGSLTGQQQLFYRTAPLEEGQDLLFPNLLNVAEGYGQTAWLCLQHVADQMHSLPWPRKIEAIIDHTFAAAFNRSSEVHEGNSYWGTAKDVDARVATVGAWQEASRENPLFVLEVPWRPAGTTVSAELESMLNRVSVPAPMTCATDLVGTITQTRRRSRRK